MFYPEPLEIPLEYHTEFCNLIPLTVENVKEDFIALMKAKKLLNELTGGLYPPDGYTIEDNRKDTLLQIDEADKRNEFAYSIFDSKNEVVLGCLYIKSLVNRIQKVSILDVYENEIPVNSLDAYYTIWTIPDVTKDFEEKLDRDLLEWFKIKWNFSAVYKMIELGLKGEVKKLPKEDLYHVADAYGRELTFIKIM